MICIVPFKYSVSSPFEQVALIIANGCQLLLNHRIKSVIRESWLVRIRVTKFSC